MKPDRPPSLIFRELCRFALYFAAASASFSGYYQKWHFAEADMPGEHSRAGFESMVDGTAYRPYVYRQLLPTLANLTDRVLPPAFKQSLAHSEADSGNPLVYAISASPTVSKPEYATRYLALYLFTFLSALLAMYAMFLLCREIGVGKPGSDFAPVVTMLLLPYFMSVGGFFYDFPELALMAFTVFLVLRFDWWWAIPVVALGAWNKESFLLFLFTLYPLLRRKYSTGKTCIALASLCAACTLVYLFLRAKYAHNPGGTVETWWLEQVKYLLHPSHLLFAWEETYGIPALKIYTVLPMVLLLWIVHRGWRYLSQPLRQHTKIALAINLPLYFAFAYPGELRDLSMLYIAFLTLLAYVINEQTGTPRLNRDAAGQVPLDLL